MRRLLAAADRFRGIPKWRRVAIGTSIAVPVFLLASLLPLAGDCIPWESPSAAAFYLQASFPALILATWYVFLVGGYLYSALVITAVNEWATDTRRPVSVLVGGTVLYWLGPAFTLAADACGADAGQLLLRNFVCFGLVQLTAQWFTFLDDVPELNGIMFTPDAIRRFTALHWAVVLGVAALILSLVGWQLALLYAVGRLYVYLGCLAGLVLLVWAVAKCLARTHHFHFHHYLLGLLAPFFPVPGPVSSIAQAILIGIAIEGLARWGPDPVFVRHKPAAPDAPPLLLAETPSPADGSAGAAGGPPSREQRVANALEGRGAGGTGNGEDKDTAGVPTAVIVRVKNALLVDGEGEDGGEG